MIITLCGSTRFEDYFKAWNEALTLAGHSVFSLSVYPSDKGKKLWYTPEIKIEMDKAHFRKIEASDAIFVLNKCAYIGESTLNEIQFAKRLDKKIFFIESWGKGYGVNDTHYLHYRQHIKKKYGLDFTNSPISTVVGQGDGYLCPWNSNLLGPAGPVRNYIVKLIDELSLIREDENA